MNPFHFEPGQKWFFVFAHPDDEIAIAAWMKRLAEGGAQVHAAWAHSDEEREEEAILASKQIGLAECDLEFYGFPDKRIADNLARLRNEIGRSVAEFMPDRIVCAAFEQGHIDHDAVHVATRLAAGAIPVLEFPEYSPYTPFIKALAEFTQGEPGEVLNLSGEEINWKVRLIAAYHSQALPKLLMWRRIQDALVCRDPYWMMRETLRFASKMDFRTPARPEWIEKNPFCRKQWRAWLEAYGAFEATGLSTR